MQEVLFVASSLAALNNKMTDFKPLLKLTHFLIILQYSLFIFVVCCSYYYYFHFKIHFNMAKLSVLKNFLLLDVSMHLYVHIFPILTNLFFSKEQYLRLLNQSTMFIHTKSWYIYFKKVINILSLCLKFFLSLSSPLRPDTSCRAGKYTYVANWFSFHLTCAIWAQKWPHHFCSSGYHPDTVLTSACAKLLQCSRFICIL